MRRSKVFLGSMLLLFSTFYFFDPITFVFPPAPVVASVPVDPYAVYQPFVEKYAGTLDRVIHRAKVPGAAVIIVKDTTILFANGYGLKKANGNDTIDLNTVFRIGSLSKGFAGVLTGILQNDNQVTIDEKVVNVLPDFQLNNPAYSENVQIQHLLTHTSGLPYHAYTNLIELGYNIDQIMVQLKDVQLIAPPGEIYAYQNVAFGLIEPIIEQKMGKNFPELLSDKIFNPIGMVNASASFEQIEANSNKAFPHKFSRRGKNWNASKITKKYYNLPSTGGVNASILDMGQWIKLLVGGFPEVAPDTTLDLVFKDYVTTNIKNRYFRNWKNLESASYGLGWRILTFPNDTLYYHGGYVNEFRGEIAISRKDKIGICLLFNAPSHVANLCVPEFWHQFKAFRDSTFNQIPMDSIQSPLKYTDLKN